MGELGDLGDFLKEGSVSDLDWLDVEEGSYRKEEILPKQNLDIQPDLMALWDRKGESPTNYLIPNKGIIPGASKPDTMGDMSDVHGPLSGSAQEIRKVARLALMQSTDLRRWRETMVSRFGSEILQGHREVLSSVLQERGLLGKLYVEASDFPGCHNSPKTATTFVRRFASEARFVIAKDKCGECSHNHGNPMGTGSSCSVFHKQLEVEVPYTEQLAQKVEQSQGSKGFVAHLTHLVAGPITKDANGESREVAVVGYTPKQRIRLAMLNESSVQGGIYQGQGLDKIPKVAQIAPQILDQKLIQASELVRSKQAITQAQIDGRPVVAFLKREMVKGLSEDELNRGLKIAFDRDLLTKTVGQWGHLLNEAGLYGVIYSTQDSFDDCRVGADFFAKHNPSVRAIVAGDKCVSCIYHKVSTCMMYGKKLVKHASELYTPEIVDAVLLEHRTASRLQPWSGKISSAWDSDPRVALQAIHKAVSRDQGPMTAATRLDHMVGYFGGVQDQHVVNSQTTRLVVKQAAEYMNEGLYGKDLLKVLKGRFEVRDLVAAGADLKVALSEQGLQGIYYIDPTAYADYGKGCEKAARLYRSRSIEYLKVGDKCGSCVHQRRAGFCSKINKPLVQEPPYTDKRAQQREILASGASTEIDLAGLVNNGASMIAEFEMQNRGLNVEVNSIVEAPTSEIQFSTGTIEF